MKELILLRHAKSSWKQAVDDIDRPLLPKGMAAISAVAKHGVSLFQTFDRVISSPANRAFHTSILLLRFANGVLSKLRIHPDLYTFDAASITSFVHALPNHLDRVILVGHNPALSEAAAQFSYQTPPALKTADWVHFKFKTSNWEAVKKGEFTYHSKQTAISSYSHEK